MCVEEQKSEKMSREAASLGVEQGAPQQTKDSERPQQNAPTSQHQAQTSQEMDAPDQRSRDKNAKRELSK